MKLTLTNDELNVAAKLAALTIIQMIRDDLNGNSSRVFKNFGDRVTDVIKNRILETCEGSLSGVIQ